mgnify:CR=1 FL=1
MHAIAILGHEHTVIHLQDKYAPNTPDLKWLGFLGANRDWNTISCDAFTKTREETEAIRRLARCTFTFAGGYADLPIWTQAYKIVPRWPEVSKTAATARIGQVFRVHLGSTKVEEITHR